MAADDTSIHVENLIGLDEPARQQYIAKLASCKGVEDDLLYLVKIGLGLRSNGNYLLADEVFEKTLMTPARFAGLYELGVSKSLQGIVDQSVYYLETRLAEAGLMPREKLLLGLQYARQSRLDRAQAIVEEIIISDPEMEKECLTHWQGYRFIERHDKQR